jgi:hypothetical protein
MWLAATLGMIALAALVPSTGVAVVTEKNRADMAELR